MTLSTAELISRAQEVMQEAQTIRAELEPAIRQSQAIQEQARQLRDTYTAKAEAPDSRAGNQGLS